MISPLTLIMSSVVISLLLASALVHASWNALVRSSEDRLWSISMLSLVGAVAALPFVAVLQAPALQSWPYLLLSSLLQIGYCLFLVRAYRHGELANIYPIARGSAPLLVTLGAVIFAGELPDRIGMAGIALVSVGIVILAVGKNRADTKSILAALAAGAFIASYMVVDGLGVRISESATGYAASQAVVSGFTIPLAFVAIRRRAPSLPRGRKGAVIIIAGILSTLGYGVAVWAMSLSSMGGVSAIRETSILFAALIGILILREQITFQKIIGAIVITLGVVSLSIS